MGKSARWIKNVLLGKKSSKSSGSKGKERVLNEKEVLITAKIEESDAVSDLPSIPNAVSNMADASSGMLETVKIGDEKVSDNEIQVHEGQVTDFEGADSVPDNSLSEEEKIQQEKAATAVQAAFRGYLARRAFWALKGIIRLQALIRGHLVRRQAVAALCCVMGIVRLQALARGREVRHSDIGVEVQSKCGLQSLLEKEHADLVGTQTYLGITKLTSNTFALKLLASSPKVMPFQFHYDSSDPNSISNWLENWSASHFWKPIAQPKKASVRKTQKKFANNSQSEAEATRSKKSVRKVPAANLDNPLVQTSFEIEKPKRNFRKVPSQSVEPPAVENPQSELEKVKRSLRKVHNPVVENSIQPHLDPQVEAEKPKLAVEKATESPSSPPPVHEPVNVFSKEETVNASDGEMKIEMPANVIGQPEEVHSPAPLETIEVLESSQVDQHDDNAVVESKPVMVKKAKEEKIPKPNSTENSADKESQRWGKKGSVNAKAERQESNGNQSNPTIPSYMQATQSAKAKLRLQGSPRSDGAEKNNNVVTRRHSLPSSLNGRVTSQSPRTARATNSGGKISGKNEKPLLSSREGNAKTSQVEWKR